MRRSSIWPRAWHRGAAISVLATALLMSGCVKDSAGGGASRPQGQGCKLNPPPAAAPAPATPSSQPKPKPDAHTMRVGLAYDIGGRGDASFNDASAAGLQRAKDEMGLAEVRELSASPGEPEDAKQTRLRQLAREGFNPVIAVGFAYADSVKAVAPEFPGTRFALIDSSAEGLPNVTPLEFAEEQGSFLMGVIAANRSKNCHVGFVGGVKTPLIGKFEAGFTQGARAAATNIEIKTTYLTPAGDYSGFQDPNKGSEVAQGQIDGGADVIYHAAGASGKGVFSAAQGARAMAIGVDSDQYNQPTVAQYRDVIVSSMLKRVDLAVYEFIAAAARNDLGSLPKKFDLSVDGVAYSTSGAKIQDLVPTLDAYKAAIASGQIKVSDKPGN